MGQNWMLNLYWHLPVFLQELCLSGYAMKLDRLYYGTEFEKWYRLYTEQKSKFLSARHVNDWQAQRLGPIFQAAVTHVPYYRSNLAGIDATCIRTPNDLRQLPILEKQTLRDRPDSLVDERLDLSKMFKDSTSGSTGTSINVFWTRRDIQRFAAAGEVRISGAAGVSRNLPRAMIGGRPIVKGNTQSPPFWGYNRHWRQLYMSSLHISKINTKYYVDALKRFGSLWLTGYGSSIAALAEDALVQGIEPMALRTVIVSGDTLQPGMRRSIEKFFGCQCRDNYGQTEGVCFAMECEHGRMHVAPEFGILEILREDGNPCAPGEVGEIVATGLINEGMPLIRYRVGDYAAWSEEQDCPCGSVLPVIDSLQGRTNDYILASDGRRISRIARMTYGLTCIQSLQIVQIRPGHAYVLIRPSDSYRSNDGLAVRNNIHSVVGNFDLEIVVVPEIPKAPSRKTPLVVRLSERPEMLPAYEPLLPKVELRYFQEIGHG